MEQMMAGLGSTTPLVALDAVVIDTETTSLDPRKAWIVEVAGVRLVGGRLDGCATLQSRLRPPVPIPAVATGVHGIDDAAVASAPSFADIWPKLMDFVGDGVVIGHAIGFDLAVLEREIGRTGARWTRPRMLDTRL